MVHRGNFGWRNVRRSCHVPAMVVLKNLSGRIAVEGIAFGPLDVDLFARLRPLLGVWVCGCVCMCVCVCLSYLGACVRLLFSKSTSYLFHASHPTCITVILPPSSCFRYPATRGNEYSRGSEIRCCN